MYLGKAAGQATDIIFSLEAAHFASRMQDSQSGYLQKGLELGSKLLEGAPGVPVLQLGYWVAGQSPIDWALEAGVQQV